MMGRHELQRAGGRDEVGPWGGAPYGRADGADSGVDALSELRGYLDIVKRRWWLILLPAVLAAVATWWFQRDARPQYEAEVLLQQRPERPVVQDLLASSGPQSEFGSQVEIIRSRAVLAPVVDSLGLQLQLPERRAERSRIFEAVQAQRDIPDRAYSLGLEGDSVVLRDAASSDRISAALPDGWLEGPGFQVRIGDAKRLATPVLFWMANQDAAIRQLRSGLEIEQGKGPDLIWVRYQNPDPRLAAQVANTIAVSYQEHRARTAREAASRRREVIAEELVDLSDSLRAVQGLVLDYQQSTQLLDPEVEGNALLSARLETEEQLRELRFHEAQLRGLVGRLESGGVDDQTLQRIMALGGGLVPNADGLSDRLQELQAERSRLTASRFGYTDQQPQVQALDSLIQNTKQQLRVAAQQGLEMLRARIQSTEARVGELRAEVSAVPSRGAEYDRLQQRVTAVQDVYDNLVEEYYQAQITEDVEVGDVEVVDAATIPVQPEPARRGLKLAIALMAGLVIGSVGAAFMEQLDSSVRSPPEAERAAGLQVIGTVPRIRAGTGNGLEARRGKEAFRAIRTNLRFALAHPPRTLAITSATPREGKSTVASNLAMTLVEQGNRVLLIDADLRRPLLHTLFGLAREPGLSNVLLGEVDVDEAVHTYGDYPNMHILTAGTETTIPSELVGGEEFTELLALLEARYDAVLIDTPPLLAVTDASLVASLVDGTVVVVRANQTAEEALEKAVAQLRRVGASLAGMVLNGVTFGNEGNYGYAYYDSYYMEPGEGSRRGRERRRREAEQERFLLETEATGRVKGD